MITKRLLASTALVVGLAGLSACGSEATGGPQATTVNLSTNAQYARKAPATTAPPAATVAPEAIIVGEQQYTIQGGDSFSKIASMFGFTVDQIVKYNGFTSSQHLLVPGAVIKIPPNGKNPAAAPAATPAPAADAAAASDSATAADSSEGCTYTIVAGDWPNKVAKKFEITVEQLETANPGGVMTTFLVGAELQIPPGGKC